MCLLLPNKKIRTGIMQRRQIRFYGRVQGVGFRYHAKHAAAALGLTGWVRNEYDGDDGSTGK